MAASKMRVGCVVRRSGNRVAYKEAFYRRYISSKKDTIRSSIIRGSYDYKRAETNARFVRAGTILVGEPFIVDDEIRQSVELWVDWVNAARDY